MSGIANFVLWISSGIFIAFMAIMLMVGLVVSIAKYPWLLIIPLLSGLIAGSIVVHRSLKKFYK